MEAIVPRIQPICKSFLYANRYAESILLTSGKKTCSELARVSERSHDAVLRDLNAIAKNPEEIKASLLEYVIERNRKQKGYLILDFTLPGL